MMTIKCIQPTITHGHWSYGIRTLKKHCLNENSYDDWNHYHCEVVTFDLCDQSENWVSHLNGFCISKSYQQSDLGHVYSRMFCEMALSLVSFVALVALERPFPSMCLHVALQLTRTGTHVIALVTLVWLFSCVLPHHVIFQMASFYAGILTHCASVRLFSRVGPFVLFQMAWLNCSKVTLIALIWLLSSVFHNVPF